MEPKNYLMIGIGGLIILIAASVGINNLHPSDPNATHVAISLDNSKLYRTSESYQSTNELFSPTGVTLSFSTPSATISTVKCALSCQYLEEDTK